MLNRLKGPAESRSGARPLLPWSTFFARRSYSKRGPAHFFRRRPERFSEPPSGFCRLQLVQDNIELFRQVLKHLFRRGRLFH